MRDPLHVKNSVADPNNRNPDPIDPEFLQNYWSDLSLASGYPGVLLLLTELDSLFPDEKWDAVAHMYVLKIKESIATQGIHSISLYSGLAGTCFAIQQASRNESRYQKIIHSLNKYLVQEIEQKYLSPLKEILQHYQPSPIVLYDLIEGVVGIGIYCLKNFSLAPFSHLLQEILILLINLTQQIQVNGKQVPGWYIPSHYQFLDKDKKFYLNGSFNLGLAHGIPGVLAFLAIASLNGVVVEGQKEAIERVADWIKNHRKEHNKLFFWKTVISFEEEIAQRNSDDLFSGRDAWCYGTPGVASSLFLAGKALQNEQLKVFALDSFYSVFARSHEERQLPGPTFCHGISGLLMISHIMFQETSSHKLEKQVEILKQDLLKLYHPEYLFGFKDVEPTEGGKYAEVEQVGLLEGVAGVALTLLSLENNPSWWHAPLLISDGKQNKR